MRPVFETDPEMDQLILQETNRQNNGLTLIPSENHSSKAVLQALSSSLSDKYAEGYPGKRYYSGNAIVDQVETLVQDRAKKLFGVPYVNVQPYSGSPANFAVHLATCKPGDPFMGLDLPHGGHLTHGWKNNATAQFWKSIPYHLNVDGSTNLEELRTLVQKEKPKLIWCGGTAIPRTIPFQALAKIADEVGTYLAADISHIAGLIVGNIHESPVSYAHIITTTTHKTLRGPRGGIIMVTEKGLKKDPELPTKIDKAIIPGFQGGPHINTIASIGVALHEAAQPSFQAYAQKIVENAHVLTDELIKKGFTLVSGGTDNHLILIDLTPSGIGRGTLLQTALEQCNIYTNKNTIPFDQGSPLYPSGLRIGTPAATTRGMGAKEMKQIADWIVRVADHIKDTTMPTDKDKRRAALIAFERACKQDAFFGSIRSNVETLCAKFPLPTLR